MPSGLLIAFSLLAAFLCSGQGTSGQTNGASGAALSKCSVKAVEAPVQGTLAAGAGRVYVGTANGTLSSLDGRNLDIVWRAELGGEFVSDIVVLDVGAIAVTNQASGAVVQDGSTARLISRDSGVVSWAAKLPFADRYYLGKLGDEIAAVGSNGSFILLDRGTGKVLRVSGPHGRLTARPSFSETGVVFGTADKSLIVLSLKEGEPISTHPIEYKPTAVAFLKNDGIAAGDERGNVLRFGANERKSVWKFKSGAAVSSVLETDEGILVTSLDNFVYLISDYNGDVIWKRRLAGRVVDRGLLLDGHFIVLIYGENSGYVIDMKNGRVTDIISESAADLINRAPVSAGGRTFTLTTVNTVETFALGGCATK